MGFAFDANAATFWLSPTALQEPESKESAKEPADENQADNERADNERADNERVEKDQDGNAKPDSAGEKTVQPQRKKSYNNPFVIEFRGPIGRFNRKFLASKIARARSLKADLLVIEIDSPGGTVVDSFECARLINEIDWAHTVAYIPKEAFSGGTITALGCDEIILTDSGTMGDVGVIGFDGGGMARYAEEKFRSPVVSQALGLAKDKGRSKELVEAMIDKDVIVFERKQWKDPDERFTMRRSEWIFGENQEKPEGALGMPDEKNWTMVPETDQGKFLTLDGERAVELGIATMTSPSREELLESFNADSAPVVLKKTTSDVVVFVLNTTFVTVLLLGIGIIALYFEFSAPGISIGGLTSGLCFALFFWSRFLGGTSGWLEVLLFLAGVAFLLVEIFVIPGFGFSGIGGFLLILVSIIMASQDFIWPKNSIQYETMTSSLASLAIAMFSSVVGGILITKYMGRMPFLNKLILSPPSAEPSNQPKVDEAGIPLIVKGHSISLGDFGLAESVLRPAGKAKIGQQTIDVVSDGSFVNPGEEIRVSEIRGNVIIVSKLEDD